MCTAREAGAGAGAGAGAVAVAGAEWLTSFERVGGEHVSALALAAN